MNLYISALIGASIFSISLSAQTVTETDVVIPFDISSAGHRYYPTWGLDQAWLSEQNIRKGINHMGRENIGIGRTCFRTTTALQNDTLLSADQTAMLTKRNAFLDLVSDTLPLTLTADQDAGSDSYYVVNRSADVKHWAAAINSHVHWLQQNSRHPIVGVSPFNEPDYWTVEEGATIDKHAQVARLLKESFPRMKGIAIIGGNTLNDDEALRWYTGGSQYYDWGNTHQLAGSLESYANFFQRLKADGKVGLADEMHNVGDAMVGLENGMTVGIWWAFDSRARGEFCDISRHGERLAYGEHRDNWTSASVYRHDDGRVKAFLGSSERQASSTTYCFLSLDRDVYFDGHGPQRLFREEIPGGTAYQKGQVNAERVIDITYGEDVQPKAIEAGIYQLVNRATGNVLAVSADNVVLQKYTGGQNQKWNVAPVNSRVGGDYSFYDITSVSDNQTRPNVLDFSTLDKANVMAYGKNQVPTSNEQWYLEYAGEGYFYIRNRESALYLTSESSVKTNGVNVIQSELQKRESVRQRQQWRLLDTGTAYEVQAPDVPSGLTATSLHTSVLLNWHRGAEADLSSYMVLRAVEGTDNWNTIARIPISATDADTELSFQDNTALLGYTYMYKVKAVDECQNISPASETVNIHLPAGREMTGRWPLYLTLDDATGSQRVAMADHQPTYVESDSSMQFNREQFLLLPPSVVQGDALSVAMWVKVRSNSAGQRLFDFGHDRNHYLFLTPNDGKSMRLAINDGTGEQALSAAEALPTSKWVHVVMAFAPGDVSLYLNGQQIAHTDAITARLSDVKAVLNYLGRSQQGSSHFLNGFLREVCVFNYPLSQEQVSQLYHNPSAVSAVQDQPGGTDQVQPVFNLSGIRQDKPRRGLTIYGGHSYLHK